MSTPPFSVERFDHVVINTHDVEATADWYVRVLGMRKESYDDDGAQRVSLHFGRQKFNVRPTGAEGWVTARVDAPGSLDLCLITEATAEQVAEHLGAVGVDVYDGPVTRTGAVGSMTSHYVLDPEGNIIEIATYDR